MLVVGDRREIPVGGADLEELRFVAAILVWVFGSVTSGVKVDADQATASEVDLQEHASAELRGLMRAFTACWEQDAPLRNVLEHEEEYIRGGGRQRNVFDPAHLDDPPVRAASAAIPRPLMSFEIYGRTLDFGPHTARANAMKQLLLEWESALGAPPG